MTARKTTARPNTPAEKAPATRDPDEVTPAEVTAILEAIEQAAATGLPLCIDWEGTKTFYSVAVTDDPGN
jgi:hypothetical protein